MYICIALSVDLNIYIYTYIYIHIYMYIYTHVYIYIYTYMYIYIYTCIYIYTYVYIYIDMYIYICIYIYMCIHIICFRSTHWDQQEWFFNHPGSGPLFSYLEKNCSTAESTAGFYVHHPTWSWNMKLYTSILH